MAKMKLETYEKHSETMLQPFDLQGVIDEKVKEAEAASDIGLDEMIERSRKLKSSMSTHSDANLAVHSGEPEDAKERDSSDEEREEGGIDVYFIKDEIRKI
jgi:hypothetical protein